MIAAIMSYLDACELIANLNLHRLEICFKKNYEKNIEWDETYLTTNVVNRVRSFKVKN